MAVASVHGQPTWDDMATLTFLRPKEQNYLRILRTGFFILRCYFDLLQKKAVTMSVLLFMSKMMGNVFDELSHMIRRSSAAVYAIFCTSGRAQVY